MSELIPFLFRWRADGEDHEKVVEAKTYPEACYELGRLHVAELMSDEDVMAGRAVVPEDFRLDLTKTERVESECPECHSFNGAHAWDCSILHCV